MCIGCAMPSLHTQWISMASSNVSRFCGRDEQTVLFPPAFRSLPWTNPRLQWQHLSLDFSKLWPVPRIAIHQNPEVPLKLSCPPTHSPNASFCFDPLCAQKGKKARVKNSTIQPALRLLALWNAQTPPCRSEVCTPSSENIIEWISWALGSLEPHPNISLKIITNCIQNEKCNHNNITLKYVEARFGQTFGSAVHQCFAGLLQPFKYLVRSGLEQMSWGAHRRWRIVFLGLHRWKHDMTQLSRQKVRRCEKNFGKRPAWCPRQGHSRFHAVPAEHHYVQYTFSGARVVRSKQPKGFLHNLE